MAAQSYSKPIYSGRYRHAMDKKHRITVPARWRSENEEEEEFYIIPDQGNSYLLVMPPAEFEKVEEKVNAQEGLTQMERREFIRRFYSSAQLCSSDKQGRMLLPEEHRRQVGIKD
ncbi:MAG TPA: hypothetical protein VG733_17980, partial [Chthoniobacteraceae bacterium]|nr:hypothetical protein [Chthoniobacteraceae bacterium]